MTFPLVARKINSSKYLSKLAKKCARIIFILMFQVFYYRILLQYTVCTVNRCDITAQLQDLYNCVMRYHCMIHTVAWTVFNTDYGSYSLLLQNLSNKVLCDCIFLSTRLLVASDLHCYVFHKSVSTYGFDHVVKSNMWYIIQINDTQASWRVSGIHSLKLIENKSLRKFTDNPRPSDKSMSAMQSLILCLFFFCLFFS